MPAYFGAEPCVGSNTATPCPKLPPGAGDRDRLDREARGGLGQLVGVRLDPGGQVLRLLAALPVFDPGVDVLGGLADDRQFDVVETGADAGVGLAGPHLRVQVEAL